MPFSKSQTRMLESIATRWLRKWPSRATQLGLEPTCQSSAARPQTQTTASTAHTCGNPICGMAVQRTSRSVRPGSQSTCTICRAEVHGPSQTTLAAQHPSRACRIYSLCFSRSDPTASHQPCSTRTCRYCDSNTISPDKCKPDGGRGSWQVYKKDASHEPPAVVEKEGRPPHFELDPTMSCAKTVVADLTLDNPGVPTQAT
jgi:hypothetical protein